MIKLVLTCSALALTAVSAQAGGVERSHSPYSILWEKGNYVELSYGRIMPDVSGVSPPALGSLNSGSMLSDYNQTTLAFKYALTPDLDLALVIDQPIGADVAYPGGPQGGSTVAYPVSRSNAVVDSNAVTALLRYRINENWSVHGGLKAQRTSGQIEIFNPNLPGGRYTMDSSTETDIGVLLGAAYEIPDIALRVALTWQSAIKHDFTATETLPGFPGGPVSRDTAFEVEVPQSLTLDFQSGVAEDTLVFGSVRWREWGAFNITPPFYSSFGSSDPQNPTNSLVAYPRNVVTLNLGVGRKFTENFAASISVGYEKSNDFRTSNLGPHNGMKSITIGASYTQDNWKFSGGVTYAKLGDATTYAPMNGQFKDNDSVAVGFKVGYSF
ncbi:OmpP1/FadL family transporter [Pseudogemmobacter bohemicus]|uniref:OmpP1/FadL family transporter n=1 Tax=Pseudogemmobacter bohemicus TaxID=2250708 RepID=UPI000DD493A9|nr:hypothetical protein [Pseudogemmobacter bohemicus]